jgi:23S rRNA pseudouridine2605 synthase
MGVFSRRECEKLLLKNKIKINNKNAVIGSKVDINDVITVNNKKYIVTEDLFKLEIKAIAYHKRCGEIVSKKDRKTKNTVFEQLPYTINKWINIGRLDVNTSGLLLFTNNGDLAHKLMHPSSNIERIYKVKIKGNFNREKMILCEKGIDIGNNEIGCFAKITKDENNSYLLTLTTGKNREIRRVLEKVNCNAEKLKRISYGPINLEGIKEGQYKILNNSEIKLLLN